MPETKIQARQRKLNKKIGTTGTDPFIPARMPGQMRSSTRIPSQPLVPTRRRVHWGWIALTISLVLLVSGMVLALRHWHLIP